MLTLDNSTKTLWNLEQDQFKQLLAPTIFLAILMVVGIPGNLCILLIYGRRNKKSVHQTIVWNLAIADQIFCAVGIPFNIARLVDYHSFKGEWLCIIGVVMLYFLLVYSTHLLMLLSIHRFKKICYPWSKQISRNNVKYFIIGCQFSALLLSSPHFGLSKYIKVDLGNNQTGYSCAISLAKPSVYSTIASYGFLSLFSLYTIILIFMYSMIGWKLYNQKKQHQKSRQDNKDITSKFTKIAFTISIVFALSYIPLFTIQIARKYIDEQNLTAYAFSALRIGERLYVINQVVNPFIYGVYDEDFYKEFKEILKCHCPKIGRTNSNYSSSEKHLQRNNSSSKNLSDTNYVSSLDNNNP